jgi:hypothetical protein
VMNRPSPLNRVGSRDEQNGSYSDGSTPARRVISRNGVELSDVS